MALNNQKNFIVAGIVILLAAVGAAAWIHESNRPAAANDYSAQLTPNGQPYNPNYAAAAPPAVSTGEGYYPLTERPAYIPATSCLRAGQRSGCGRPVRGSARAGIPDLP